MKLIRKLMKLPAAVYNFFNMFHKDKGAHFTYNMGVSMMRLGLLCFFAAVGVSVLFFLSDCPAFVKKDKVMAVVTECGVQEVDGEEVECVSFSGESKKGGAAFEQTQRCTSAGLQYYEQYIDSDLAREYNRYSVTGRPDFISYHGTFMARREYYWAYPDTPKPVPVWLAGVLLILMVMFFYIGKREIGISMKYPRNDVPEEVTGVPAVYPGDPGFVPPPGGEKGKVGYDKLLEERSQ